MLPKKLSYQHSTEYSKTKKNKKNLLYSLLINSHCCCCGKVLPIFDKNYKGYYRQFFDSRGYYYGKYCSAYCVNRLDEYLQENDYPPNHQVCSGTDGEGFFENLIVNYGDVNKDVNIGLVIKN